MFDWARNALRKAVKDYVWGSFSTDSYGEWYARNGYRVIANKLGYNSRGGRNVTEDQALSCTACYAGVKIISEDVGSLPLKLFSKKNDSRDELVDDPLYELLHDQPNPETTAMEFREALTSHAVLCGNGYAEIVRSGDRVLALWPIMPDRVEPKRSDNGATFYLIRGTGSFSIGPAGSFKSQDRNVAFENIFHLRGFTRDTVQGVDVLNYARSAIGLMISQEDYASRYFEEDAIPGITLEHPLKLDDPGAVEAIKEQWKKTVKSHGVAVLQEGMKANVIGKTNTDSQLIEQRRFSILDLCRVLRLPPHKLADLERATFSNIAEQNIQYYSETIRPWCTRWEQTIKLRLLKGRKGVYAEHSIDAFMLGDFESQSVALARLLEKGVWSINEVRALFNMNPIKDGDQHFIQLNMQTVVDAANAEVGTQPNSTRQNVVELPRNQQRVVRVQAQQAPRHSRGRHPALLHKDCSDRLDLKDLTEDQGVFSGWLSKYNVVDRQSDIVVPGAFTKSLAKSGPRLPLLWMHKDPVGGVVLSERPEGLWAEGKLLPMREVPLARYAFEAMKAGVVGSMSIGYETVQREVKGDIRYLTEINLYEGSLVAVPALAEARIETVKNLFSSDTFDFIEEIDQEVKAGRSISKASRDRILAAIEQGQSAIAQLQALLNSESDEGDGKGIAKHSEESLANFQKALERAIQWKH